MRRKRNSSVERSRWAREKSKREACKKAILQRLYTASATIEELDSAAAFPKPLINAVVNDLLHEGRITNNGFTYHYKHSVQFLKENL